MDGVRKFTSEEQTHARTHTKTKTKTKNFQALSKSPKAIYKYDEVKNRADERTDERKKKNPPVYK